MATACSISPAPDSFVSGLLGYLDCQAVTLGSQGFMALANPGSSVSLLLVGLLTILVALIGYRLLFGETPGVREGVMTFAKIGLVLAFTTSWPAYRTVVFDVVLRTPADLAGEIGRPAGLPGANGGLAGRMDAVDRSFRILAIYGVGTPTRDQVEQANGIAPPLFANFDVFALGAARVVFLVGSLGAFALVRLSAGLLLGLGPLFVAFLLFGATRGIAEGWIRGLLGAAFGSTAIAVVLGVELALLEPWLGNLVSQRASGVAIPGVPVTVLAASMIFAIATAGLLALVTRVSLGLRLSSDRWQMPGLSSATAAASPVRGAGTSTSTTTAAAAASTGTRSRAAAIADSVAASDRRTETITSVGLSRAQTVGGSVVRTERGSSPIAGTPLGQSFNRRTARRVSSGAGKRDKTS